MVKLIDVAGPQLGEYRVVLGGVAVHFIFEVQSHADALFEARHKGAPLVGQYFALPPNNFIEAAPRVVEDAYQLLLG